jgi:nucleoside-diphosphate-sugar epimerase
LVTILPGLVVGKPLHSRHFTSGEICEKMFTGEFSVLRVKVPLVRVEDVSRAHLQAIKVPEAAGQRFVLNEKCYWNREIAQSMANVYNP